MKRRLLIYILLLITLSFSAAKEIKHSLPVSSNPELNIKNLAGTLKIKGWENEEIMIEGTCSNSLDRMIIEQKGNKVIIRAETEGKKKKNAPIIRCDLKIYTPYNSSVNIDLGSSDLNLKDIEGNISITSVSGDINIDSQARKMAVQSISGDIDIYGSARRFEGVSISGEIRVNGDFPSIKVQTTSGELRYKGSLLEHASVYSTSGEVRISCTKLEGSHIEIGTVSGNARLEIPENSSVELQLKSVNGSLSANTRNYDSIISEKRELLLRRSDGDSMIYIETLSGEIKIVE